jgi:hypothetical protein
MSLQILERIIDKKKYTIIHKKNNGKGIYPPLMDALLERITEKQLKGLPVNTIHGKTILFMDLINCYYWHIGSGEVFNESAIADELNEYQCICGHKIINKFNITNKEDSESYIVGCCCIQSQLIHYLKKEYRMRLINSILKKNDDVLDTRCIFCNKKTTKKSCINCKKQKLKELCMSIIRKWKRKLKRHSCYCCNKLIDLKFKYCYKCNIQIQESKNKCNSCNKMIEKEYNQCYTCRFGSKQEQNIH